jgi:hypothetical protein
MLTLIMAAAAHAKLIIVGHPQSTVIDYPTMARCLAAKAEIERQFETEYQRDLARGIMRTPPQIYCVPS